MKRFSTTAFLAAVKNECETHNSQIVSDMTLDIKYISKRLCGEGENQNDSDSLAQIQSAAICIQETTKGFKLLAEDIERRVKNKLRFPEANLDGFVDLLDVMEVIVEMRNEVITGRNQAFDFSPIEYVFEESSSFFDDVIRKAFVPF